MHTSQVNELTASWARQLDGDGVLSGAGLWPLLAVLASSADEPGRGELAGAVGVDADQCMDAAREVLKMIGDADGVDAALGVWAQETARVSPDWAAQLPPAGFGQLTGDPRVDQPKLDAWAREQTGGLVERFPVGTDPDLMLILATAVALRTSWTRTFTDEPLSPKRGPWARRRLAGLQRTTPGVDDLRTAQTPAGALTLTRIEGDNGLDVHLVLGEDTRRAGEVVPAAIQVLAGTHEVQTGSTLLEDDSAPDAPGVAVVRSQRPSLAVRTVRFTVRSEHDLLQQARLFGLATVCRPGRGHFSRIGSVPLRVDQAVQAAVAVFSATGFEAAAVTAVGLRAVSMPVLNARGLQVTYDRPFGFVAVHRATGLVLFAGWVGTAEPRTE